MKYVVDTNIINRLVHGAMQPEDLPFDGEFIATHVQIDELNKTQDQERRARLFIKFTTLKIDVMYPNQTSEVVRQGFVGNVISR